RRIHPAGHAGGKPEPEHQDCQSAHPIHVSPQFAGSVEERFRTQVDSSNLLRTWFPREGDLATLRFAGFLRRARRDSQEQIVVSLYDPPYDRRTTALRPTGDATRQRGTPPEDEGICSSRADLTGRSTRL